MSGVHKISNEIKKSKKPIFIIGESALIGKKGKYIFEEIKFFLYQNNFITKEWNALNILSQNASRVGAIELGIYSITKNNNFHFFDKLDNDEFKFLYLLGADDFNFNKEKKFIVYQGSHGDKGAEIADIILPGSAYTEKDGLFVNLEGKIQNAYKATYPPGDSKEDWIVFKDLAKLMKKPFKYNNSNELRKLIIKIISNETIKASKNLITTDYVDDDISIKLIDYYHTNVIARSSKVMNECRQISKSFLYTGIEQAS